jgi:hypothetical protein
MDALLFDSKWCTRPFSPLVNLPERVRVSPSSGLQTGPGFPDSVLAALIIF